jgi:hypothetical protein
MLRSTFLLLLLALLPQQPPPPAPQTNAAQASSSDAPIYTADGQLKLPEKYREWIFLSSGVDMSYTPGAADHSMFDNVFVNPSSYQAFQQTGTWPDKTTLVLEVREAKGASSINKSGHTQSPDIMGLEIHVKDANLPGGWAFFEANSPTTTRLIRRPASCYQCHESHAAVDTTFVQFYPTLLGLAKSKGTLSPAYLKEIDAPAANK